MYFFFQAEDGIRDYDVTGVQTCALRSFLGIDDGAACGFFIDPENQLVNERLILGTEDRGFLVDRGADIGCCGQAAGLPQKRDDPGASLNLRRPPPVDGLADDGLFGDGHRGITALKLFPRRRRPKFGFGRQIGRGHVRTPVTE